MMLKFAFSNRTAFEGWGTMEPAIWQEQIDLYAQLNQFSKRVPKLEEVMTLDILKATAKRDPESVSLGSACSRRTSYRHLPRLPRLTR